MKKFVQIALIVVLVLVLLQTIAGGPVASAGDLGSNATSSNSVKAHTSVEDVHASACLIKNKYVKCVKPDVGWNS